MNSVISPFEGEKQSGYPMGDVVVSVRRRMSLTEIDSRDTCRKSVKFLNLKVCA